MAATTTSIVYSTQVTHIGSGASLAPAAISASTDVSTALASTNTARYPRCDIAVMIAPTASIALASNTLVLYRRDLNIDGTSDESVLTSTSNLPHVAAVLVVPASTTVSTTHYLKASDVALPSDDCEFYLSNQLGVNIPIGWTLKVTPKSDAAA